MELTQGLHLAYCTNVHRGENWAETFQSLQDDTLRVKDWVCPDGPYGIGLRLSALAAAELLTGDNLATFRRWLADNHCYVYTINGFPYGAFHGTRVKEEVFLPDWSDPARVEYTLNLFTILAALMTDLPADLYGSVSTLPATFKAFAPDEDKLRAINDNLLAVARHLDELEDETGRRFLLGLEPEPLGWFETTVETIAFFHDLREYAGDGQRDLVDTYLGVTYDTCHQAVEFEAAAQSLFLLREAQIPIAKFHLSNALSLRVQPEAIEQLRCFDEPTYLHQVVGQNPETRELYRYLDLPDALGDIEAGAVEENEEWHVHFHVPVQCLDIDALSTTGLHVTSTLDQVEAHPEMCKHFEIETYTWEVLPPHLRDGDVAHQLAYEYAWTLAQFKVRGFLALAEAEV